MRARSWWAAAGLAAVLTSGSAAEEAEYIVTAWRSPEEVRQTGLSTTVIGEEEIRASGAADVADLLRRVPGIRVARVGGAGTLSTTYVRGGEADFCLVLVDGVQVNQPGGTFNWAHLPLTDVERIEVVRGPASVVYGGDAPSAVVQVFTRRGEGEPRYEVFGEGGSSGTAREGFSASGATGDVGWSLGLERLDTKNHLAVNNDYGRTSLSGRVDLPVGRTTEVAATFSLVDRTLEDPSDNGGDLLPPFVLDPNATTRAVATTAGLTVTRRLGERLDAVLALSRFGESQNQWDPADTIADGNAWITSFHGEQEVARFTSDLHLDWRPRLGARDWLVTLGGEFEEEEFHTVTNMSLWGASRTNLSRTNGAAYLALSGDVLPKLHFSGGARVDDNSRFAREVSLRGALAWSLPDGTTLRAAGGDGFRTPSFTEIASTFTNFVPNPNLRGENERTWEVGVDRSFMDDRLDLSATFFRASTKGLIRTITAGATMTPWNLQRAERYGVEASLDWRMAPRWTLGGTWTYLETRITAPGPANLVLFQRDQRLPRIPKHQASARLAYGGGRLRAWTDVRATSHMVDGDFSGFDLETYVTRRVRNGGFAVWDAAAEWDVLENLTLTASGTNLFGKRYQEVYGFSAPGADWRAGARWRF